MKTYLGGGEKEEKEMGDEDHSDDKSIIDGLRRGDQWSTDDFVNKYKNRLLLFLEHRMKVPWDVAQDLLNEVFYEVASNPEVIRPGTDKLDRFLYTVCRNSAIDWHRKIKSEKEHFAEVMRELLSEGEVSNPWVESRAEFPESHIVLLRQSLSGLDRKKRVVLTMWAEGEPDRKIAEALREKEGTIRQIRKRALVEVGERYLNQLDNKSPQDQATIRKKLKLD